MMEHVLGEVPVRLLAGDGLQQYETAGNTRGHAAAEGESCKATGGVGEGLTGDARCCPSRQLCRTCGM
jgi:hypothetical protein